MWTEVVANSLRLYVVLIDVSTVGCPVHVDLKDLILVFLPSACNYEAREPLTYSGKLKLRAPSATLDGKWTCAPVGPLALVALRISSCWTTWCSQSAGEAGLRVSASG